MQEKCDGRKAKKEDEEDGDKNDRERDSSWIEDRRWRREVGKLKKGWEGEKGRCTIPQRFSFHQNVGLLKVRDSRKGC